MSGGANVGQRKIKTFSLSADSRKYSQMTSVITGLSRFLPVSVCILLR
jgi:hypothetical protein